MRGLGEARRLDSHHARWPELVEMHAAQRRRGREVVQRGRHDQRPLGLLFSSHLARDVSLGKAKLAEVLILPQPA